MAFFLRSLFSDSSSQQTKPPTEQTTFAPIPQLLVDNNGIPSPHRSTLFRAGGSENSLRHFNNTDMAASQQTRAARKQKAPPPPPRFSKLQTTIPCASSGPVASCSSVSDQDPKEYLRSMNKRKLREWLESEECEEFSGMTGKALVEANRDSLLRDFPDANHIAITNLLTARNDFLSPGYTGLPPLKKSVQSNQNVQSNTSTYSIRSPIEIERFDLPCKSVKVTKSLLWESAQNKDRGCLSYASAADVAGFIKTALDDALVAIELSKFTEINSETTLGSNRADLLMSRNATGIPYVVIEAKLPLGEMSDEAAETEDPNLERYLPQLYDYMMRIRVSHHVSPVFGIFGLYDMWYYCVLCDENERLPAFDGQPVSPISSETYLPRTPKSANLSKESEDSSPPLNLFAESETNTNETTEEIDDNEVDEQIPPRILHVSQKCMWNDESFWKTLACFLETAYFCSKSQKPPSSNGLRLVQKVQENSSGINWVPRSYGPESLSTDPPPIKCSEYLLWAKLGSGSFGRVHLASSQSTKQACAIKFFYSKDEKGDAKKEAEWWGRVYDKKFQVKATSIMGRKALVMPVFYPIPTCHRSKFIQKIEDTCVELRKKGIRHGDVKWRNIGLTATREVVLLDLGRMSECDSMDNGWVDDAIKELKRRMGSQQAVCAGMSDRFSDALVIGDREMKGKEKMGEELGL